jgi:predicted phosphodiesterase
MKIGVISDVHGNLAALDAVLADLESNGAWK